MPERTYTGPLPRGTVTFPDDTTVAFVRGVPIDVTADQAKALDDDWSTPGAKAAKKTKVPKADEATKPEEGTS